MVSVRNSETDDIEPKAVEGTSGHIDAGPGHVPGASPSLAMPLSGPV